jgi:hypothetical protein
MKKSASVLAAILALAALPLRAAVTVKTLQSTSELPGPLAAFVQKGDVLARNGKFLAVAGGVPRRLVSSFNSSLAEALGCVLAFVPDGRGIRPLAVVGAPSLRIQSKNQTIAYATARIEGGALIAKAAWSGPDKSRLDIQTRIDFRLDEGKIVLTSDVRNAGPADIAGVSYALGANALQSYNFSPYQAPAFPDLNFRVYERPDHVLGWFNPNPVETREAPLPGRLRPGQSYRVTYALFTADDVPSILDKLYAMARVRPERATVEFKDFAGPGEVIVQDAAAGATFFRSFLAKASPLSIPLPKGTYTVTANLFPAVRELKLTVGGEAAAAKIVFTPVFGKVRLAVKDSRGRTVPAKVSFLGLGRTPSPYFEPESPVVSGRGWETAKNSAYPPPEGVTTALPTGSYLVAASRGPEYSLETRVIEVLEGGTQGLAFTLDKAVDTRGLVSFDPHMHTVNSDGTVAVPERLRSIVVEGLDVAVATDHNYITDYKTDLDRLGLADLLAFIPGEEVTARSGSIHYNSYAVTPKPTEINNGAISIEDETPKTLFGLSRAAFPGSLTQVNHPRSRGLGYFLFYDLDPARAAAAKAPFDLDFDLMEAMNGPRLNEANRQSIEDWFHLLNRGYGIRIMGSSDTHTIEGAEPGYSRTYVLYGGPKGKALDVPAFLRAVKEGRSFVSNGPIVAARAGKSTFGDMATAKKGRLDLAVKVTGAPWLDVSEVRLVVNGERKIVLPVKNPSSAEVKFDQKIRLELAGDAWIAVEVVGARTLFPVLQRIAGSGRPADAALPYALTNPILVDVDGNGRFDPPWKDKVRIK